MVSNGNQLFADTFDCTEPLKEDVVRYALLHAFQIFIF